MKLKIDNLPKTIPNQETNVQDQKWRFKMNLSQIQFGMTIEKRILKINKVLTES